MPVPKPRPHAALRRTTPVRFSFFLLLAPGLAATPAVVPDPPDGSRPRPSPFAPAPPRPGLAPPPQKIPGPPRRPPKFDTRVGDEPPKHPQPAPPAGGEQPPDKDAAAAAGPELYLLDDHPFAALFLL